MNKYLPLILLFSSSAFALEIQIQGEVYQAVEDHLATGKARNVIHLHDEKAQKSYRLQFADDKIPDQFKNLRAGSKYKIRGKKVTPSVVSYLSGELVSPLETVTYPTTSLKGTRKVLGVRVNFADSPAVCSDASAASILFDPASPESVKGYFQNNSRGMLDILGDVVTVNISSSIAQSASCDYNTWSNLANQALQSSGINLSNYQHWMYFLPSNVPCGWAGLGNIGGGNTWVAYCSGYVMSHELGHNFGLGHASAGGSEYGDASDTMGNSYRQLNSPHRHQLGWVGNEKIQTVSNLGVYRISTLNEDPTLQSLPQVIRIARPNTSEFVYLSYRSSVGAFDTGLAATYSGKLNIHRYRGSGYANTFFIAGVGVGESHDLSEGDYSINVLSRDATSIEFSLSTNQTCLEAAPTLTLSGEFIVKPGASISSSLSLRNNHSLACNNQVFDLSIAAHDSVSATLSPSMLDLAYGASGSSAIALGVSVSAATGTYTLPVKAVNRANMVYATTGTVQVRVDATAPSVPMNVSLSSRKNTVSVSYSPSTDNVAMGFYKILRNGIVVGQSSSTAFSNTGVPAGTHSYQVIAVDRAGNESAASAAVMITVSSTGGGKPRK